MFSNAGSRSTMPISVANSAGGQAAPFSATDWLVMWPVTWGIRLPFQPPTRSAHAGCATPRGSRGLHAAASADDSG